MVKVADVALELRVGVLIGPRRITSTVRLRVLSLPSSPWASKASGPFAQPGSGAPTPTGSAIRAMGEGVPAGTPSRGGLERLGKLGCGIHRVN